MRRSLLLFTSKTIKTICFGLLASGFLGALPAPAAGTIWTVTSTADSATDTTTLRGAVNAAASGDFIDLSQITGTIVLTLGEIGIGKQITIGGPGSSKLAISGNNVSRVFHFQAGSAGSAIQSLTIENGNGNIDATHPDNNGGAIRVFEGPLLITSCVFTNNSAMYGGAIYVFLGMTFSGGDLTFQHNSATYGGAIYSDSASGGAISQSYFESNTASIAGGAIYFNSASYDFNNDSLFYNLAGSSTALGSGAGIYISSGVNMHMQHAVFWNNFIVSTTEAGLAGGSAITNLGTLTIETTEIAYNLGNVGSIWNGGTLNVGDVTMADNDTAIFNSGTADVDWATIASNTSYGIVNAGGATFSLQNSILSGNPSANCLNDGTFNSLDFNLSDDATCAAVLTQPGDFPPLTPAGLDPTGLRNNNGPTNDTGFTTQTIALEPGSKAVNAITVTADCVNIPDFGASDERGVLRPQDKFCDIGAYEATPDFYYSSISGIATNPGGAGTTNLTVNSFAGFNAPVTFTVQGAASGLTVSLSANPVTPPNDGSTSSSVTINVGPSVTPGAYNVGLVGTSALLVHEAVIPVSVQATTASLTHVLADDRSLGCVNTGVDVTLTIELLLAQAEMNAGHMQAANDVLNLSLFEVNLEAGRGISTTCKDSQGNQFNAAQVLTTDIQAVQGSL
jgi:predicted outer membrane repeat protein